jgi:predicted TIM-barrel fold metal-dependent hydrolase
MFAACDAAGVRGIRVNLEARGALHLDEAAQAQALEAAARVAARFGWHVQTYANFTVLSGLRDTIRRLPTPLVADHFARASAQEAESGDPKFQAVLDLVADGHLYVKLSAPHRSGAHGAGADMGSVVRALVAANAERMLWGSDWPHTQPVAGPDGIAPFEAIDDVFALERLSGWVQNPATLGKIMVDNPAHLYGF